MIDFYSRGGCVNRNEMVCFQLVQILQDISRIFDMLSSYYHSDKANDQNCCNHRSYDGHRFTKYACRWQCYDGSHPKCGQLYSFSQTLQFRWNHLSKGNGLLWEEDSAKLFGILIDSSLKFDNHVKMIWFKK